PGWRTSNSELLTTRPPTIPETTTIPTSVFFTEFGTASGWAAFRGTGRSRGVGCRSADLLRLRWGASGRTRHKAAPTATVAPGWTTTSTTTPAAGLATSMVALLASTTATTSPTATACPGRTRIDSTSTDSSAGPEPMAVTATQPSS